MGRPMEELADVLYDIPKEYGFAFDVVHYILCIMTVRADMGDEFDSTAAEHPLVGKSSIYLFPEACIGSGFAIVGLLVFSHDDLLRRRSAHRPPLWRARARFPNRRPAPPPRRHRTLVGDVLRAQGHSAQDRQGAEGRQAPAVCH